MPSWTDEEGYDWYGKLECKRCLRRMTADHGEVPPHDCLGGRWASQSYTEVMHVPVPVPAGMTDDQWWAYLEAERRAAIPDALRAIAKTLFGTADDEARDRVRNMVDPEDWP